MDDSQIENVFPMPLDVEQGKVYRWCGCGQSKTQPLCDKEDCKDRCFLYKAILTETLYFCGCKQTRDPPFCDGSHAKVLLELVNKRKSQSQ